MSKALVQHGISANQKQIQQGKLYLHFNSLLLRNLLIAKEFYLNINWGLCIKTCKQAEMQKNPNIPAEFVANF